MSGSNLLLGFLLFVLGHAFAWFQLNSQFAWSWWKDKPILAVAIYSIPIGLCFWHAARLIFEETGAAWSARFMGFAASYFIFPILTYIFLKESMFTAKTMICILLSLTIILVQVFWK